MLYVIATRKPLFFFLKFKKTWVKNLVATDALSLQCLRSETCQVLRVVSVVKINCLIMLKLSAFPKQWSPYQVMCLS
jgi:hypothetical protein